MNCSILACICIYTYFTYSLSYLVAYRDYNYSVFAATSVGEGPPADGSFLTREDGESINTFVVGMKNYSRIITPSHYIILDSIIS